MLQYVNRRELKEHTSEVLALLKTGKNVVITCRGKPEAVLSEYNEDFLENYVFTHSSKFKKLLKKTKGEKHSDFRKFLQEEGIV